MTFHVADEEGRPVEGATMRIRSLDAYVPFETAFQDRAGIWEPVRVPQYALLEYVASRPGWTSRRRVGMYGDSPTLQKFDFFFGSLDGADNWDYSNAAFFLSDHPEIASIEPGTGTFVVDPEDGAHVVDTPRVAIVITFSEPFDEATRKRLAAAVRLWPADAVSGNPDAVDVAATANVDEGDGLADLDLDFRPGATSKPAAGAIHMGLDGRARTTWDAEGRTLTFAVDGPMGETGKTLHYQVGLVSDGERFADPTGHVLGTDHTGRRDGVVPAGRLLANTVCLGENELFALWQIPGTLPPTAEQRWNGTHASTYGFRLKIGR